MLHQFSTTVPQLKAAASKGFKLYRQKMCTETDTFCLIADTGGQAGSSQEQPFFKKEGFYYTARYNKIDFLEFYR